MRTAGVPTEKIVAARYALCTLIDETATSTPWGASGAWAQRGLLALFHGETGGGEKFFQLLARLAENPAGQPRLSSSSCTSVSSSASRDATGSSTVASASSRRSGNGSSRSSASSAESTSAICLRSWRGVSAAAQSRLGWLPLWVVGAVAGAPPRRHLRRIQARASAAPPTGLAGDIARLRVAARVAPAPGWRRREPASEPRLAPFFVERDPNVASSPSTTAPTEVS